jgi:hypothetical protein
MHSSFTPAGLADNSPRLTLDQVEKFYLELSRLACLTSNRWSSLAKKIQTNYFSYINNLFYSDANEDKRRHALGKQIKFLISQKIFKEILENSLLETIYQDILGNGRLLVAAFDEDNTYQTLLNTLADIRTNQPQITTPMLPSLPQTFSHDTFIYQHLPFETALESIIAEGDSYLANNNLPAAIKNYLTGNKVLLLTTSEDYINICRYSVKIQAKLGMSYLLYARSWLPINSHVASKLLVLASKATEHLEFTENNIWLNAQHDLAILFFVTANEAEHTNLDYAITLINHSIILWQGIANKYQNINILSMNELHEHNNKLAELWMRKLLSQQTLTFRDQISLANKVIDVITSMSFEVINDENLRNLITVRKLYSTLSLQMVTHNITVKTKLRYLNEAIWQNNQSDYNNIKPSDCFTHQQIFIRLLMQAVTSVLPSLNSQQILKYGAILDAELDKIPLPLIDDVCAFNHATIKIESAFHLFYLSYPKDFTRPRSFQELKKLQKKYRTIFNFWVCIDRDYISHSDKLNNSWWHQQYACFGLEAVLLDPNYASPTNIAFVRNMIFENNQSLMNPFDFEQRTNNFHRHFSKLLLIYALKLKSDVHSDKMVVIQFIQSCILTVKRIPKMNQTEEDKSNLLSYKKLLQHTEAKWLNDMSLDKAAEEQNIKRILSLIGEIERLDCEGYEEEDSWHMNLLNLKYVNVISYCEQHLDRNIDILAASLLIKPGFFSFEYQGHENAGDLKKLFYGVVKPLKTNKCENLFAEALTEIETYLTRSSLYRDSIKKIQLAITPLAVMQINNLPASQSLTRRQSM